MRWYVWVITGLLATSAGPTRLAHAARIEVRAARVALGDLLPQVAEPWASLDMGPAPGVGQQARLTRQDIVRRLAQAQLPLPPDVEVPRVVQLTRVGQSISEPRLAAWVRQELIHSLPPGSRVAALRVGAGVTLPPGQVQVTLALPETLGPGTHTLTAWVRALPPEGLQPALPAEADPEAVPLSVYAELGAMAARRPVPVLARGAEVVVQVRSASVLVQSMGLTQQAGSIGEVVGVLPTQGG
jgi:hypothetical protein